MTRGPLGLRAGGRRVDAASILPDAAGADAAFADASASPDASEPGPDAGCAPSCSGKTCGDDDGCDGRCTVCPAGQACDNNSWKCVSCVPDCSGKICGEPDGCNAKCTGCPAGQYCDRTTWQCTTGTRDPGAGNPCRCDSSGVCTIACLIGKSTHCIVTNETTGDGYCSHNCRGAGFDDQCQADFPGGCCQSDNTQSLPHCRRSDECSAGTCDYLESCGAGSSCGNCKEGLVCTGFYQGGSQYCVYACTPSAAPCPDQGYCKSLDATHGICGPPGPHKVGELCKNGSDGCAPGLLCYDMNLSGGFCTTTCSGGCGSEVCSNCDLNTNDCYCFDSCGATPDVTKCPGGGAGWSCVDVAAPPAHSYVCWLP